METVKQWSVKHKIPEGAVMLTRHEALTEQMTLIYKWKPQSDVWPLIHGRGILAMTTSIVSLYINHRFRQRLKLRHISSIPSAILVAGGPPLLVGLFHTPVLNKLLLLEASCPFCLEFKGALIQSCFGLLVPIFAIPFVNFAVTGSKVHNIPYAYEIRKAFTIMRSAFQPMLPTLGLLFIFQALFGSYMVHLQIKSYLRILNIQYLVDREEKATRVYIRE